MPPKRGGLHVPRPAHALDMLIAAVALFKQLSVVARNTADFTRIGGSLVNPFDAD